MASKNSNDHWAFLEEIEAPMWVDLTLEANSNNQHIDDEWFYKSHLFHQCSSRQLKAAFSNSGEDIMALHYDLVGPSSPKLPSSVSKSRGKDFVSKKWREDNQDLSLYKWHQGKVPSGRSSCRISGSSDEMKPKSSFIHLKGTSSSKSSSVCKGSLTGNRIINCSKPTSACEDQPCSLSSMTNKADESSTTSTITCESGQQQQKCMGKSNQPLSHTNGLLSVIRTSMRKSSVITWPASRVDINADRRQSRGRKSSSSKSSVGSSSNPCYNGRTSESGQQQKQKFLEKSNQPLSQTNGLLSVIKTGLRKSGVTLPASRVSINGERRQSRGRNSSTSKSSVGSSSNPGYDGRTSTCTSTRYKERTPDSNLARMTYAANNRIKSSKVCKTSTHKIEQGTQNSRMKPNDANSVHLEAAKPKVQYQSISRKPLEPVRVNEKKSSTAPVKSKEKAVVGGSTRLAASGKENVKGRMGGSQKGNSKGIAGVTVVWSPKATKEIILQRNDRTGLGGKVRVSGQSRRVNLKDVPKRLHFR